jgi:glutamate racemase
MINGPIGIFDSGVGGITIYKEINKLMPNESIIYLSDNLNSPYGNKSKEEIKNFSIKNTNWLIEKGCKIIVVACNTATTNSIDYLRNTYKIPFVGVEPAIKPAANNTKTGVVGVLATKGTLTSNLFNITSNDYCSEIKIIESDGKGLVELIENGIFSGEKLEKMLKLFIDPMISANIDYLVLGCTHYPLISKSLKKFLPRNVKILDSGIAVAKQTKFLINKNNLVNQNDKSESIFYCNSKTSALEKVLQKNSIIEKI